MFTRIVASFALLALLFFAGTGCFHATIETGLTPSSETIEESFASGWIYGLVPPSTVSAQAKCKHGVAKVETWHSFVNQLVSFVTFSIYTPMSIKVTCAASGTSMLEGRTPDLIVGENAGEQEREKIFMRAAALAYASGKAVYVQY